MVTKHNPHRFVDFSLEEAEDSVIHVAVNEETVLWIRLEKNDDGSLYIFAGDLNWSNPTQMTTTVPGVFAAPAH